MKKIIGIFILTLLSTTTFAGPPTMLPPLPDFPDEYPAKITKNDYIKKSYSKRDSYDFKFRMNSSVEKYLNISEELEKLKKIAEILKNADDITEKIKRLEKLRNKYKAEYIKNYKKLKDKKGVKTWEELEKIFPEYLEIKSMMKRDLKTRITQDYEYRRKHFFSHKINYIINKDVFKKADNIFLVYSLYTEEDYIPRIRLANENNFLKFYNFSFYQYLKEKEKKQTLEKIISDKNIFLAKKIEKNKGEFISNKSGEINYNLIVQKGDIFFSIGSRTIYGGLPSFLSEEDKKEINRQKESFFRRLSEKDVVYPYEIGDFIYNDLKDYMKKTLRKRLDKFNSIENKQKFLEKIEKVIKKISNGKKDKIEKLMESFTSDEQIEEISKKYNTINKQAKIFNIFLSVVKEEKDILEFKKVENLILR